MMENEVTPLDFLPEALVEEMLKKNNAVVDGLRERVRRISLLKQDSREKLREIGILTNVDNIINTPQHPTTVGVDGTYSIIKQLSLDTVAIAAVAVEGLLPPKEIGFWEKPQHRLSVDSVSHNVETDVICEAIMFSYELELAVKAPHDVIFLDGSYISYLLTTSKALYAAKNAGEYNDEQSLILQLFEERLPELLDNLREVATSPDPKKNYIGMPKYSTRTDVINYLINQGSPPSTFMQLNDKGLLSLILRSGDVVGPISLPPFSLDNIPVGGFPNKYMSRGIELKKVLQNIQSVFIKPSLLQPALRAELAPSIALNQERLATVLDAIREQSNLPGIIEPYPNHIADLFVKQIHGALKELRESSLSKLGADSDLDFPDVYLFMHSYRSEERSE
jgi:hypothetical protein